MVQRKLRWSGSFFIGVACIAQAPPLVKREDTNAVITLRTLVSTADTIHKKAGEKMSTDVIDCISAGRDAVNHIRRCLYPRSREEMPATPSSRACAAVIDQVLAASDNDLYEAGQNIFNAVNGSTKMQRRSSGICASAAVFKAHAKLQELFATFEQRPVNREDNVNVTCSARLSQRKPVIDQQKTCKYYSPILLLDRFSGKPFALCSTCCGYPQELWCDSCKQNYAQKEQSGMNTNILPYIAVDDSIAYLNSRIGAKSRMIDEHVEQYRNVSSQDESDKEKGSANEYDDLINVLGIMHTSADLADAYAKKVDALPDDFAQNLSRILQVHPRMVRFAEAVMNVQQEGYGITKIAAWFASTLLIGQERCDQLTSARNALPEEVARVSEVVSEIHSFIDRHGAQDLIPFINHILELYGDRLEHSMKKSGRWSSALYQALAPFLHIDSSRIYYLGEQASDVLRELGGTWYESMPFVPFSKYKLLRENITLYKKNNPPVSYVTAINKVDSDDDEYNDCADGV